MSSTDECSSGTIIRISQMVCGLIFIPSSTAWDYSSKHATMLMSSKIVHFRAVTMRWDKIESLFIHHHNMSLHKPEYTTLAVCDISSNSSSSGGGGRIITHEHKTKAPYDQNHHHANR